MKILHLRGVFVFAALICCVCGCGKSSNGPVPSSLNNENTNAGGSKTSDTCDFRKYRPVVLSNFVRCCAKKRIWPEFPLEIRKEGTIVQVEIVFMVNIRGEVVDTCGNVAQIVCSGEDERTKRQWTKSVLGSAEAAVRQWRFVPNFGFHETSIEYVKARVVYRFVVKDGRRTISYSSD